MEQKDMDLVNEQISALIEQTSKINNQNHLLIAAIASISTMIILFGGIFIAKHFL
ncbi:MAG: hypothetical protein V3U71_04015 [Cocleimonas sp.]